MTDFPIGTIIAFAGSYDVNQEALGDLGWRLCNGDPVLPNDPDYSAIQKHWNTTFGEDPSNGALFLPDLCGRFLRGVDPNGKVDPDGDGRTAQNPGGNTGRAVGSQQTDGVGPHGHSYTDYNNTKRTAAPYQCLPINPPSATQPTVNPQPSNGGSDDDGAGLQTDTRPNNMYVEFVVKTREMPFPSVFAGMVVQAGGYVSDPSLWVECNGDPIPDPDSDLATNIDELYGVDANGAHLPNYNSMFLRGVAHGSNADPGRDQRTAPTNFPTPGSGGDNVGSYQSSALAAHTHSFNQLTCHCNICQEPDCCAPRVVGYQCCCRFSGSDTSDAQGATKEARPRNCALPHLISTTNGSPADDEYIPVGSIVAYCADMKWLAGTSWILCDGSSLERKTHPRLADVLVGAHGAPNDEEFLIPDLRGLFVRGLDGASDRMSPRPDARHPGNVTGLGSIQMDSVSGHTHQVQVINPSTFTSQPYSGDVTVLAADSGALEVDGDTGFSDTRPANTYVYFIIKAG
jgi:microcystin-dependent protein